MFHFYWRAAGLAAGLWLASAAGAANASAGLKDLLPDFATAKAQFEAGRAGSESATAQAQQTLAQLLRGDADNPLYLAYYGSTFTLQGRDSRAPWKKIRLVNQGVAILDRALTLLDQARARAQALAGMAELETRLVAIATFVALPDALFHRLDTARSQYQRALASPAYATAPAEVRGHLLYEGALIARQERDVAAERAALEHVLALDPVSVGRSVDLAEVRARLAELH